MKITDSSSKLPPAAAIGERSSPERSASEQVSLSKAARALLTPEAAPVYVGKVSEIRQQIAEGSYRIDASQIADRLMVAASKLFSRRH